jgi:hypothetical protein
LTFDKAALDVSQVFLPGAYVALSRLRSLEGLILLSPLRMNGISNDQDVMDYSLNKASDSFLANALHFETKFIHNYLINTFDWSELAQEWRNHRFSYNEVLKFQGNQNMRYGPKQNESSNSFGSIQKIHIAIEQAFAPETVDLIMSRNAFKPLLVIF